MFEPKWYSKPPFGTPIIIAALLIAVTIYAGDNQQTQDTDRQRADHAGHHPSEVIETPRSDVSARERHEEQPTAENETGNGLIVLTDTLAQWLMMIGTLATVGLVGWTLHVTRGLLKEAHSASKAAADSVEVTRLMLLESEKATAAALSTVDVTRTMGEAQTRAYLSAKELQVQRFPAAKSPIGTVSQKPEQWAARVFLQVNNSGNSPAIGYRGAIEFGTWTQAEAEQRVVNTDEHGGLEVIFPGSPIVIQGWFPAAFSADNIDTVFGELSGRRLWVKGTLEYRDVFGKFWRVEFLKYLRDPQRLKDVKDGIGLALNAHSVGNEYREIEKIE